MGEKKDDDSMDDGIAFNCRLQLVGAFMYGLTSSQFKWLLVSQHRQSSCEPPP